MTRKPLFVPLKRSVVAVLLTGMAGWQLPAQAYTYAPWLSQIGISDTLEANAKWGKGQLIGIIDTGMDGGHSQFAPGQIAKASRCITASQIDCATRMADDHGHGTAVGSIAAGNTRSDGDYYYGIDRRVQLGDFIGVAPAANLIAMKTLGASGVGNYDDVAKGVKLAADAGAKVINLSLTYTPNVAAVTDAINYATAKGAYIVWAGGNAGGNFATSDTTGLTSNALKRLIFVGSVDAKGQVSSFSNRPQSGRVYDKWGASTTYANRWVMAPGEQILAPMIKSGSGAYGFWAGTSMAAPVTAGSLALLLNTWPILKTNGTAANLLLATADYSAANKGAVDTTVGAGQINLARAFAPYGFLRVTLANGSTMSVSKVTGSLITGGAFGDLSLISSSLSNYTSFDGYARNFKVNLSGLIQTPTRSAKLNPLPKYSYSAPTVMSYNGGEVSYALFPTNDRLRLLGDVFARPDLEASPYTGYSLFTSKEGVVMGMGYGDASTYPFAKALFNDPGLSIAMSDFDTGGIANIAQGGYNFSYGAPLSPALRWAASYAAVPAWTGDAGRTPYNTQVRMGASYQMSPALTAGLTFGSLSEQSGLLGSVYQPGSALSLGDNQTSVIGVSLAYQLAPQRSVLLNSEFGHTAPGAGGRGLIGDTSAIESRAFGVAYREGSLFTDNDQLLLSLKQPLRVTSGTASLMTAGVDADGRAVFEKTAVSLAPEGREIDLTLHYRLPVGKQDTLSFQAAYQRDALNITGNDQRQFGALWTKSF